MKTSELIAEQSDQMQELFAYIEHAQENLLLVFQGRFKSDQGFDSVINYLECASNLANIIKKSNKI